MPATASRNAPTGEPPAPRSATPEALRNSPNAKKSVIPAPIPTTEGILPSITISTYTQEQQIAAKAAMAGASQAEPKDTVPDAAASPTEAEAILCVSDSIRNTTPTTYMRKRKIQVTLIPPIPLRLHVKEI